MTGFRLILLVEDSQGTVALISGADHVSDVEGRVCCFSSLRVRTRTNADRSVAELVTKGHMNILWMISCRFFFFFQN